MSIGRKLKFLQNAGCRPNISYRGHGIWRAHVNRAGNFWADADSPRKALTDAIELWDSKGRPMDGVRND